MSKYDFEIDLSQNTSTGIILGQLKKGSTVLEFGCATGRMTRYMKEELECQVYIVEYEKSAYETALQYAVDGVCDDIMNFQWLRKWAGIAFDAIVFADVLEHLADPRLAMQKAATLLKPEGEIYVSLPNVTHNDVVLKAYGERFDYTQTGILDNTHIHFWGVENIKELVQGSKLHLKKVTGTYCATGETEQYAGGERPSASLLQNLLKERTCGEVYQFVAVLNLHAQEETVYEFHKPSIMSHLYLDTGNDFNGAEMVEVKAEYVQGYYKVSYEFTPPQGLRRLRFDPVEMQNCIVSGLRICQGEKELPILFHNGIQTENALFLPKDDPMVCMEVTESTEVLCVEAEIWLPGEGYMSLMEEACRKKDGECHQQRAAFDVERGQLHQELITLNCNKSELQKQVQQLEGLNTELQQQLQRMQTENDGLRQDLGAYIVLANSKDKYALEQDRKVEEYRFLAEERERAIQYYQNLRIVKLRTLILRVLRGIKRRIKRGIFHG